MDIDPRPAPRPPARPAEPRPLLVTDHPALLDDLLRLAAAADVEVTVAHSVNHAERAWSTAPLVVIGADLLAPLAAALPDRHPNAVVVLPAPARAPSGGDQVWSQALRVGAHEVMSLPDHESRLVDLFADAADGGPRCAPLISVIGGRGGAGASLLAVALALAARRAGKQTVLLDADPLGGGLDLLLGHEDAPGARWPDLAARRGRLNWPALRDSLPSARGIALLAWGRGRPSPVPAVAMQAVVATALRGADLVIADLPRAFDPATDEVLRRTTRALLVVPADVHATIAAARLLPLLRERVTDLGLVVRGASPATLTADTLSLSLDLPLAGSLTDEPRLSATLAKGAPPATGPRSPLAAFGDAVVRDICSRS
ncbi:septum site-determining protein Ssd [Marinactinospora thermotolerans]|uniref:Helicase/secretion neighborhood CpaE-like protein n=1 Tax=Marinactinospora thermotolerans DSM 45154 TaxID=1122192 RepID=A0A1T4T2Q4_9ACTN|nr:septum site-determining protein Ssd [Marinactinospora thermotolerans]SKA34531.1 helicase/secretion neighborhood CpaE-like protein [Marinactinospora thermotolerans DSM 45154]